MRDSFKEWCDATEISIEHISNLACSAVENFIDADTAYISPDLFSELEKEFAEAAKHVAGRNYFSSGINGLSIMTLVGPINIKVVSGLMNFCHVGNESTYNRLEWIKIGEAFEKEILGE